MRRFTLNLFAILTIGFVGGVVLAAPVDPSNQVCLLADGGITLLPNSSLWRGRLVQNQGPNTILVTYGPQADAGTGVVAGFAVELAADVSVYLPGTGAAYGAATTATQASPNCTVVMGVP